MAVIEALDRLRAVAARFDDMAGDLAGASASRVEGIGRAQREAVRALVQIAYTSGTRFEHDPAVPQSPVPSLHEISDLVRLPAEDHASRLLHNRLVRRRNSVVYGLRTAAEVLEKALAGT